MFTENLLESSPSQTPVLTAVHWFISLVVGALTFAGAYFALGWISEGAETRVLITQSSIVGVVLFFYALMICYVYSDTRHQGFSTMLWLIITVPLNLVGFLFYLIYSAARTGNWKRATMPIAYIMEVIVIGVMVLMPLVYTEVLPKAQLMGFLVAPPPPPPPPPPAAAPVRVIRRVTVEDIMKAPTVIPKTITPIKDQPEPPPQQAAGVVGGVPGGVPGGTAGGVIGGIIGGVLSSAPPPPPKATTPKRIRVGGQVENAKQIFAPKPEYPPLAKMARIQGAVKLEAIISKDGTIQDLKILSGHPLLVKAAVEAVGRWRYQPTLLNGEPVEVITEIDVNFTLAE